MPLPVLRDLAVEDFVLLLFKCLRLPDGFGILCKLLTIYLSCGPASKHKSKVRSVLQSAGTECSLQEVHTQQASKACADLKP